MSTYWVIYVTFMVHCAKPTNQKRFAELMRKSCYDSKNTISCMCAESIFNSVLDVAVTIMLNTMPKLSNPVNNV